MATFFSKLKKIYKRNEPLFWIFLITNVASVVLIFEKYDQLQVTLETIEVEKHYNLITVNTFFAGFLYNFLGTMIEFVTRKEFKSLEKNGYLDKYFNSVYLSIFFFLVSIILGILSAFLGFFNDNFSFFLIELSFMFNGIVFFMYSALKLRKLIKKIRNPKKTINE